MFAHTSDFAIADRLAKADASYSPVKEDRDNVINRLQDGVRVDPVRSPSIDSDSEESAPYGGVPALDYTHAEFVDDGELFKGIDSALEKAGQVIQSHEQSLRQKDWTSQKNYSVKMPRLVARFPWISSTQSKVSAQKKKYRMKKLLPRRPHLPTPVGGKKSAKIVGPHPLGVLSKPQRSNPSAAKAPKIKPSSVAQSKPVKVAKPVKPAQSTPVRVAKSLRLGQMSDGSLVRIFRF